jgi:hypothetical protein
LAPYDRPAPLVRPLGKKFSRPQAEQSGHCFVLHRTKRFEIRIELRA